MNAPKRKLTKQEKKALKKRCPWCDAGKGEWCAAKKRICLLSMNGVRGSRVNAWAHDKRPAEYLHRTRR